MYSPSAASTDRLSVCLEEGGDAEDEPVGLKRDKMDAMREDVGLVEVVGGEVDGAVDEEAEGVEVDGSLVLEDVEEFRP